jgi:hypothetical protein
MVEPEELKLKPAVELTPPGLAIVSRSDNHVALIELVVPRFLIRMVETAARFSADALKSRFSPGTTVGTVKI